MNSTLTTALSVGVIAVVTWLIRALPFAVFGGKKELPKLVTYLGDVLPAAIMIILVVFCLRNATWTVFPYGLAELISIALVVLMQVWKKNTFISILVGTVCYMVLIRTVFPI